MNSLYEHVIPDIHVEEEAHCHNQEEVAAVVGSHRTVHSTAAAAWRTVGCTGLAVACRHSTVGTARTELDHPWGLDHDQALHVVVLALGLVHHTVDQVLLRTQHTLLQTQPLGLFGPKMLVNVY